MKCVMPSTRAKDNMRTYTRTPAQESVRLYALPPNFSWRLMLAAYMCMMSLHLSHRHHRRVDDGDANGGQEATR